MQLHAFDHNHYVPCVRWKQGEYQALHRLSSQAKGRLTPLIEVAELGWDFEEAKAPKTIDEHLKKVAERVRKKWGQKPAFVDLKRISTSERLNGGVHPLTYVFEGLRANEVSAIPVTCLGRQVDYQTAVRRIIAIDRRGVCLRLTLPQIHVKDFEASVMKLVREFGLSVNEVDLIVDLEAPSSFEPLDAFVGMTNASFAKIPRLDAWRTFTLLSTSFPKSMGEMTVGTQAVKRKEWACYKQLRASRTSNGRIPTFGDYVINHPEVIVTDHRKVKPSATIRYAVNDAWIVVKGKNVKDYGFGQYKRLCSELLSETNSTETGISAGDGFIRGCAAGTETTGNLSTWRWVGTNRHLEKVVADLSSLHAS